MKIDVSNIVKVDGALDVEYNDNLEELGSIEGNVVFDKPVSFSGKVVNVSGVLKLGGHLKTQYTVKCSKCLNDIDSVIDVDIKEDFISSEKDTDGGFYTYEGNFISIDNVLKDNIILNLPMRQVCTEDCKGLCTKCGSNLNVDNCNCEDDVIDSRMQVLKNFFNNND